MKSLFVRFIPQVISAKTTANLPTCNYRETVSNPLKIYPNPLHSGERMKRFALLFALTFTAIVLAGCHPNVQQTLAPAATPPSVAEATPAPQQVAKPWEQIPIPKLHDFNPHQPQRIELKNGIVLFLQEDHELPFVSGSVSIPGGSRDEDPAKTGLVRALWPGLAHQRHRQAQRRRPRRSARSQGRAHRDRRRRRLHRALLGLAQRPTPTRSFPWPSICFCIPTSARKSSSSPSSRWPPASSAATTTRTRSPSASPPSSSTAPTRPYTRQPELATIGAVTLDDLKAWHDRTIHGKLIVAISGDFDPAAMEAKLRAAFEPLPPVQARARRATTSFPVPSPASTSSTRRT